MFYFAVEFGNPATSLLATCNPKLRWEFFAPSGKLINNSFTSSLFPHFYPVILTICALSCVSAM